MFSNMGDGNGKCSATVFEIIRTYHQLNFSDCLRTLVSDKAVALKDLHQQLDLKGYYLNLESLYRYFNHKPHSNRLPPQDFVQLFAELIELTEEETALLLKFWWCCKSSKKSPY